MIDGFHIPIWNRTKKPLAIALGGMGTEQRGRDNEGNVNYVQYKSDWNCHFESSHNEYILIKNFIKI
jgi:uncharacterized protein with WD repeat